MKPFQKVDIIVGGDHGQEKFHAYIKTILRDGEDNILDMFVSKVGHIDCKKDTYDVLKKSIAGPLNEAMKRLKEAGAVNIWCRSNGEKYVSLPGNEDVHDPTDVLEGSAVL